MSRKTSGRRPTPYERALWDKVVANAKPLPRPKGLGDEDPHAPEPVRELKPKPLPRQDTRLPDDFKVGRLSKSPLPVRDLAPDAGEALGRPRMDRKQHGRVTRGKLEPEARLDLHGMTLSAAHPALNRFILDAHAAGKRLVLVITGKGKDRDDGGPIPTRIGVLRHQVPGWLRSGSLAGVVLDIATAHRKHGGSGAYYVYLRRQR